MKGRTGQSPDIADSAAILVELCRQRFGFGGMTVKAKQDRNTFEQRRLNNFRLLSHANVGRNLQKDRLSS
jgi:hypothetical protein